MLQLLPVPVAELCPATRAAAVAVLDQQQACEGAFALPGGAVVVLTLPDNGWAIDYWEPPP